MPQVFIPPLLRNLTNGQETVRVAGETVGQLIDQLELMFPGMRAGLCQGNELRPGLAAFAGAMERLMHADGGGGSVSSALFLGETLEHLQVAGTRASGTRRLASGATEDVRFVKRKGGWHIQLFTRRR